MAGFDLPNTSAGLAPFWDRNGDANYNPDEGDYPIIQIRGCEKPQFPDQMIYWIYNDAGNIHEESGGDAIQMEIQVQAFAYQTSDELNDMTFQRYRLINRAIEFIDSTYFAMWVDPDLGCYTDDYIGCDTSRSMAYIYNEDAVDGTTGCTCDQGVNTYCEDVPILGIDYFRGPLAPKMIDPITGELRNPLPGEMPDTIIELGMSSFMYFNSPAGSNPNGTYDPTIDTEFYNYLSGSWRDGTPLTYGGNGYNPGSTDYINYAFPDPPNDPNGWSMCTANLGSGDRRTVQASGPFRLDPGAVNELIVGVVWVPDMEYPCPDITRLLHADDLAQAFFDNCFPDPPAPDAPDVCFVELDEEIIAVLSNDEVRSNNAHEQFEGVDLLAPIGVDSLYRFEGYQVFQLAGPDVSISELDNPDKARVIFQADLKNGINNIYNWESTLNPNYSPANPGQPQFIWSPVLEVEANDEGIKHTFRITEDQFSSGESRKLINHKKYYFTALAYAHNNYSVFNSESLLGQRKPYVASNRNIGDGENIFYTVIPRPIVDKNLNANYGDGAIITRLDGVGVGGNFLDMSDETKETIFDGSFDGTITYKAGKGPIDIKVYDPINVKDGTFELTFVDENMDNDKLDNEVKWILKDLNTNETIASETTIEQLNEQLIIDYGFSITIGQTDDAGTNPNGNNGAIGYEQSYVDPDGADWFAGIPDAAGAPFNYIRKPPVSELDSKEALSTMGAGFFVPYALCDWEQSSSGTIYPLGAYLTPAWTDDRSNSLSLDKDDLAKLNNVDIIFTSDKSKWSRCIIVETANHYYTDFTFFPTHPTLLTEGRAKHMDVRLSPSVTKFDDNGDGKPDQDIASEGTGMGWFPGYAIDVETGERLNVFFGENSTYDELDQAAIAPIQAYDNGKPNGRDMAWNPTSQVVLDTELGGFSIFNYLSGGQHFIYVTNQTYDSCAFLRERLDPTFGNDTEYYKFGGLKKITWTGLPILPQGQQLLSYKDGLIPNDVTIKLRVDNPYDVAVGTDQFEGYPSYQFTIEGAESKELVGVEIDEALDMINVVPNPYYGYSSYETSQFTNMVKITNLPAKCDVKIFSLDGRFIRSYKRDEVGAVKTGANPPIGQGQIIPSIEWDMKNSKGIPVASGVYLIHIDAGDLGERVIKWFGVARQFDPSGL